MGISVNKLKAFSRAASAIGLGLCASASNAAELATGGWDNIVAAAKQEKAVTMYASSPVQVAIVEAFKQKFPDIAVTLINSPTTELITRMDAEIASSNVQADVLLIAQPIWEIERSKSGRFAKPVGPSAKKFPTDIVDAAVMPLSGDPFGIAYNTTIVPAGTKIDWDTLLSEKYSGMVAIAEARGQSFTSYYNWLNGRAGGNYLSRFGKLKPTIAEAASATMQLISSGEAAWTPAGIQSFVTRLKATGAPVEFVIPAGPTYVIVYNVIAMANSPHPNAGQVLLDFMIGDEGQKAAIKGGHAVSMLRAYNPDLQIEGSVAIKAADIVTTKPEDKYEVAMKELFDNELRGR